MKLPEPDTRWGYSFGYLEEIFPPELYEKFCTWMDGQTCALTADNKRVAYSHDVRQFLAGGGDLEWDMPKFLKPRPWET